LSQLGLKPAVALAAIIFKQAPEDELCIELTTAGYEIVHLPDNPHIE
jgi:hypothetical protein